MNKLLSSLVLAGFVIAGSLDAQVRDVRGELSARGVDPEFTNLVQELVADATRQGLPADPLIDKALEGLAKRVPPDRVLAVVQQVASGLVQGRDALRGAGLTDPPGRLVAAAAEALGRGLTADDVRAVLEAAPSHDAAATGLTVASSLAARGIDRADAADAVSRAFQAGRSPADVLELPSVASALLARGIPMSEVARRILEGGGLPVPPGAGPPPGTPGRGPPTNLPVQPGRPDRP